MRSINRLTVLRRYQWNSVLCTLVAEAGQRKCSRCQQVPLSPEKSCEGLHMMRVTHPLALFCAHVCGHLFGCYRNETRKQAFMIIVTDTAPLSGCHVFACKPRGSDLQSGREMVPRNVVDGNHSEKRQGGIVGGRTVGLVLRDCVQTSPMFFEKCGHGRTKGVAEVLHNAFAFRDTQRSKIRSNLRRFVSFTSMLVSHTVSVCCRAISDVELACEHVSKLCEFAVTRDGCCAT